MILDKLRQKELPEFEVGEWYFNGDSQTYFRVKSLEPEFKVYDPTFDNVQWRDHKLYVQKLDSGIIVKRHPES